MEDKKQFPIKPLKDYILEERFGFVKNNFIRENIKIYARYFLFLYSFSNKYKLHPDIIFSLYKDIIIYSAQIVEAICHYMIQELLTNEDYQKKLLGIKWENRQTMNCKFNLPELRTNNNYRITMTIEEKSKKQFKDKTNFKKLIDYCKNAELPLKFIKILDDFKEKRNRIHIGGLQLLDNLYTKKDVDRTFTDMTYVIEEIKRKLDY